MVKKNLKIRFYKSDVMICNLITRNQLKTRYKLKNYEINPEI